MLAIKRSLTLGAALVIAPSLLFLFSLSAGRPPAAFATDSPPNNGEILVKFKPGVAQPAVDAFNSAQGTRQTGFISAIGVHVLHVPSGQDAATVAGRYAHNSIVQFAEPNYIVHTQQVDPNDLYFPYQWELAKVQAPDAWGIAEAGPSMVIAVLDTGVLATQEDLVGKVLAGWNFVTGTNVTTDLNGHGTEVAGVAAAQNNNTVGMASVSWGSNVLPVSVCDSNGYCVLSNVASGITWAADNGAKVINMSLGAQLLCGSVTQSAVDYAWNKGAVLVAASGNESTSAVDTPANCNHVIAVGASDSGDTVASWSNRGSALGMVAPGVSITCPVLSGGYADCTGTSLATPMVSSAAALLLAAGASNNAAVSDLEQGADCIGGSPCWNQNDGWGRLNVYKALEILKGTITTPVTPTIGLTVKSAGGATVSTVAIGTSVSSGATLSGASGPTGTVTYAIYSNNTCTTAVTASGFPDTVTLSGGAVPNSTSWTATPAGSYWFQAKYSGDANNAAAISVCTIGALTVQNTPTLATALSSTQAAIGSAVHVDASLTGAMATAGGTVTYSAYDGTSCGGVPAFTSTVTVTNGAVPNSASFTPSAAGSYTWQAAYSGDSLDQGAGSSCGSATLIVPVNIVTITDPLSATNVGVGTAVHDTVTLSGATSNAGGTVTYAVYSDSACTAAVSAGGWPSTVTITNDTVPSSANFTPQSTGTYYFRAAYSGDANNSSATGPCGGTGETLTVTAGLSVSITAPVQGQTIGGMVSLAAGTTDSVASVTQVTFSIDGTVLKTDTTSPWTASWNTKKFANGSHTITVKATDTAGNTVTASITVTVKN